MAVTATTRDRGAEAALMLGVLGLVALPVVPSVAAVIVGVKVRRKIDADPALTGSRMAGAGIVLGVIGILAAVVVVWFFAA